MNWAERGYNVALEGELMPIGQAYYNRTCTEKWGVAVNATEFKNGYQDGLTQFCTPEYAKSFGSRGGSYHGICPKEAETKFLPQFQSGQLDYLSRRVTELERQVSDLQSDLRSRDSEISDLHSRLSTAESRSCH